MKNIERKINLSLVILIALTVGGCAQYMKWQPVIDPYGDPRGQFIQQDMNECRWIAERASGGGVNSTALDAAVGALGGAAAGAAGGMLLGNPAIGAAVGAAAGGFGGGAYGGIDSDNIFKSAFKNCLRNRGHRPVN